MVREIHKCYEHNTTESVKRFGQCLCCASAAFSYLIHLWIGNEKHTFLYDVGSEETVANAKKLEVVRWGGRGGGGI